MLIEQGTNTGYHPSTIVGTITAEPIFNVTPSGKHHAIFYVLYGRQKDEKSGKSTPKSLLCEAWDYWADVATQCEKGDRVIVFGTKAPDEYRSKKTGQKAFKVTAEFIVNAGALYSPENLNNVDTAMLEGEMQDEPSEESESVFFA